MPKPLFCILVKNTSPNFFSRQTTNHQYLVTSFLTDQVFSHHSYLVQKLQHRTSYKIKSSSSKCSTLSLLSGDSVAIVRFLENGVAPILAGLSSISSLRSGCRGPNYPGITIIWLGLFLTGLARETYLPVLSLLPMLPLCENVIHPA